MPESVTLGAAAIIKPKYEGSNEHEVIPIPIIIPKFAETPEDDSAVTQVRKRENFARGSTIYACVCSAASDCKWVR